MNKKIRVKRIFDDISGSYDFLNHFLSLGVDIYWRKKALKLTEIKSDSVLLDLACGTGDFSAESKKFNINNIYGADLSHSMLKVFNQKYDWSRGKLVQAVAENLPYKSESFTNVTVAFGVRNFYDIGTGIKSIHDVLCKGGKLTILEFRLPKNYFIRVFYNFYFNRILPFIGKIISKDKEAYHYLPESVNEFDESINMHNILISEGFKSVNSHKLTFGIVEVIIAEK